MASSGIPTIVLEGHMLDKWMKHSELIRMFAEMSPDHRVELTKPYGLSDQEWDTLTVLLEPHEESGPLLVRSHGRSVVNPLYNVSKDSIKNMIRYLMIDDEYTFRRLVGAETNAPVYSSSSSSAVATPERNRYSFNSNNNFNFNNFNRKSKKNKYKPNVPINDENSWNSYENWMKTGPVRSKRGGRRVTRRGRRSTRRAVTRRN
jgi:hypothetical protein